ncbi:MAG: peptidoglycan DD-metalloendopeptidase family protein [Planctomycetes bacterium]|nr:peptidoglycan DD-metalloendopeptidase family protein [Planctomycetota bacterium]
MLSKSITLFLLLLIMTPISIFAVVYQYPVEPYPYGSYNGRSFYFNGNHLGEDVLLSEGTHVYSIGPGVVKYYSAAGNAYGTLVVAIEHDLGVDTVFKNAYGNDITTRYILSIYGHLRPGNAGLSVNQPVSAGTLIGEVEIAALNGDGTEHLHMGIRLSNAITAQQHDGNYWLRGYEQTTTMGEDFAAASKVIGKLANITVIDNNDPFDNDFIESGPDYWVTSNGGRSHNGDFRYVLANGDILENSGKWLINGISAGNYRVEAYIPSVNATSEQAIYKINHSGIESDSNTIDQSNIFSNWAELGTYTFSGSGGEYVQLNDDTGEPLSLGRKLAFDAIRLVDLSTQTALNVIPDIQSIKINNVTVSNNPSEYISATLDNNNEFQIRLKGKNLGSDAVGFGGGGLHLSFEEFDLSSQTSNVTYDDNYSSSDFDNHNNVYHGTDAPGGDGNADYVMFEAYDDNGWTPTEENTLVVDVDPNQKTQLIIHYRAMFWNGTDWVFDGMAGNPGPIGDPTYQIVVHFSPPTLLQPADGTEFIIGESDILLDWTPVPGASGYEVWVDNLASFGDPSIGHYEAGNQDWVHNGLTTTDSFNLSTYSTRSNWHSILSLESKRKEFKWRSICLE